MKIRNYRKVEKRDAFPRDKAKGVALRVAIAKEDGARQMTMRVYEVDPGGYTIKHSHSHEHAIFVLRGRGKVASGKKECRIDKNDVLFIAGGEDHKISNDGEENLVFVSVIPIIE